MIKSTDADDVFLLRLIPSNHLLHCSNLWNKRCGPKLTRLTLLTPKCFNLTPLCILRVLAGCFGANVCVRWANRPCFFVLIWEMRTQCARRDFRLAHDQNEIWLERHPRLHYHELSYLLSIKCSQQSVNRLFCHISTQLFWMRSLFFYILNQDGRFTPCRDICMSFTPSPLHQEDLHHLSCSSFRLAWYFLPLSCSTMGASGSVCVRGVEGAAVEGHADSGF